MFFVNPPICAARPRRDLLADQRPSGAERRLADFDVLGAVLATGGMLLLVYALVRAPAVGWGSARTIGELAGAAALLVAFVINEQRSQEPARSRCRSSGSRGWPPPTSPS